MEKKGNRDAMLLVRCTTGSEAIVTYYEEGKEVRSGEAYIGRNGVGKTREGDGKTPLGEFGVRKAFGILPDPGTAFDYVTIGPGTIACDSPGPYYNQIIDPATIRLRSDADPDTIRGRSDADLESLHQDHTAETAGERMAEFSPEYDYGLELDYNPENIYPLGSAIFVHCKGSKTYTGGCVALDRDFVRDILLRAPRDLRVTII